jgi:outer membrane protein
MKKIILTAAAVFAFGFANAQTEKGNWQISGSTGLGFSSVKQKYKAENGQTQDGSKISNFNIKPAAGYFVIDNLMVGLALDYNTSTSKDGPSKYTNSAISLIPQATYFFGKSNVKPFLNAGLGLASASFKESDNGNSFSSSPSGMVWGLNGGVAFFVTKSVSFDFGLGYQSISLKSDESNNSQSITSTTSGLVSQVGISVYF